MGRVRIAFLSFVFLAGTVVASAPADAATSTFNPDPATLGAVPSGGGCDQPRKVAFSVTGLTGRVTDVSAGFTMSPAHTRVGDLAVLLLSPVLGEGFRSEQILFDGDGVDYTDDSDVAGPYTFSDSAPVSPTWAQAAAAANGTTPVAAGTYRASTTDGNVLLTPEFAGRGDPNGTWELWFCDFGTSAAGSVSAAKLSLTTEPAPDLVLAPSEPAHKCRKRNGKTVCKVSGIEVANAGSAAIPQLAKDEGILVTLYRSEQDWRAGIVWGQKLLFGPLAVGEAVSFSVKVQKGTPPPQFVIDIDTNDTVAESDEFNAWYASL